MNKLKLLGLVFIALLSISGAFAYEEISIRWDATTSDTSGLLGRYTNGAWYGQAQRFVTTATMDGIDNISINVGTISGATPQQYRVEIGSNLGDIDSSAICTSNDISITSGTTFTFQFNETCAVTENTAYWFHILRSGDSASWPSSSYIFLKTKGGTNYNGGLADDSARSEVGSASGDIYSFIAAGGSTLDISSKIYDYDIVPPTPTTTLYIPATVESTQVGTVEISSTSYTPVLSGSFTLLNDTNLSVSVSGDIIGSGSGSDASCEVNFDGTSYGNTSASAPNGEHRSLAITGFIGEATAGTYTATVNCKKDSPNKFTAENFKFIFTEYTNEDGKPLKVEENSFSATLTSSTYQPIGYYNFTTTNLTTAGDIIRFIALETTTTNEYISTGTICLKGGIAGVINSSEYCRYGTVGSTGSGSAFDLIINATNETIYPFTLYGKSTTSDGTVDLTNVNFEIITHQHETNSTELNSLAINSASYTTVASLDITNADHLSIDSVVKASFSVESLSGAADMSFRLTVSGDATDTSTVINRDVGAANQEGIVTIQEVFGGLAVGNYTINLQAQASNSNSQITGGNMIVYSTNPTPFIPDTYNVTLYDRWTNQTLTNFTVTNEVGTIFTSVGGVAVILSQADTENLTISRSLYLPSTVANHNTSLNLNTSIYQMRFSLTATEIITGNTVSPANYTIDATTITDTEYFYLTLDDFNVTFSKADWFDKTISFSSYSYLSGIVAATYTPSGICSSPVATLCVINSDGTTTGATSRCDAIQTNPLIIGYVAGSCSDLTDYLNNDAEVTITGVSSTAINMTANNLIGGTPITSFSINISNDAYSYSEIYSTTTGWIALSSLQDVPFNITIDATGYALQNVTLTPNATLFNYTFDLYTTNSINITFIDALTDAVINDRNISVDFIGSFDTYNETTSTGYLYADLITPDGYIVRYSADGYDESFYYFTMSDRTTQAVTLYLMNESATTDVTINIFDEANEELESALVKVLRFDVESGSYVQVEARLTNFEGQVVVPITLNTEFYKFIIEYPLGTIVKATQPSYISGTTLNIQVQLTQAIAENFFNKDTVSYLLTFSDVTDSFTFTYSDSQNLVSKGCLQVYRVSIKDNLLLNSSCSTSAAGSITLGVTNVTGVTYKAEAFIYYGTERTYLSSLFKSFLGAELFGTLGLFLAVIMTVFIIFVARWSLTATALMLPLPLVALRTLSIVTIGWDAIIGLIGLSLVIAFILGRKNK